MKVYLNTTNGIDAEDAIEHFPLANGKRIDWNNSSDRKWFMNHLHWAMCNDQTVIIHPESN